MGSGKMTNRGLTDPAALTALTGLTALAGETHRTASGLPGGEREFRGPERTWPERSGAGRAWRRPGRRGAVPAFVVGVPGGLTGAEQLLQRRLRLLAAADRLDDGLVEGATVLLRVAGDGAADHGVPVRGPGVL